MHCTYVCPCHKPHIQIASVDYFQVLYNLCIFPVEEHHRYPEWYPEFRLFIKKVIWLFYWLFACLICLMAGYNRG